MSPHLSVCHYRVQSESQRPHGNVGMPGKLRNCPCCTERLTKDPVSWPGQSRIFSQEEKVEVVKYIGRTSPVPGRWPEHAEGLKARFGQTGLVWEKICSSCYTRVSGALTGYLQEKFEAAARTGGRHDRQQVRAFSATVKEQEENRKRKQQEKQQQQQQQQYGQAEGGVEGRARVTRAASRAAAVAVAAAAAAEAAAAGAVSPAAAAAAATMLAVALGGDATGDVQMVEAAARGSPNNSSTPTRHHTQPQGKLILLLVHAAELHAYTWMTSNRRMLHVQALAVRRRHPAHTGYSRLRPVAQHNPRPLRLRPQVRVHNRQRM